MFVSVQLLSHVWLCVTLWTAARQASLSITNSWSLLKFTSIELVMPSNHLILCRPLLLPSIFPSIRAHSLTGKLKLNQTTQLGQTIFLPVEDSGCESLLVWCKSLLLHFGVHGIQKWINKVSTQMLEGFVKKGRASSGALSHLAMGLPSNFLLAFSQKLSQGWALGHKPT